MQQARLCMVNFQKFCKSFLSNVVGRQVYNRKIACETISCIATVSNEAFVMLCLEKSQARWKHEAPEYSEEIQKVPVYTASPAEASKYGGWNEPGIHCFNVLQQHIVSEMHPTSARMEADFMDEQQQQRKEANAPKKAKF
jgi:hypothetical protein